MRSLAILGLAAIVLAGCANYTTPGAGVSLASISDSDIAEAYQREPAMTWPAHLAVARVAGPGYNSRTASSYGQGAYSIVSTRDIETEDDFTRLGRMPQVAGIAPVSRLLISNNLETVRDLRTAAAQLRADAIVIYTIDTRFRTDTMELGPLQTVALGFLPSRKATVNATCAFMIVDVRTGFIYGAGEATATEDQRANVWGTDQAVEAARQRAERAAFQQGLDEIEALWPSIVAQHAGRQATPAG